MLNRMPLINSHLGLSGLSMYFTTLIDNVRIQNMRDTLIRIPTYSVTCNPSDRKQNIIRDDCTGAVSSPRLLFY